EAPSHSIDNSPAPLVVQAESLEMRDKKYGEAIAIYRRLLESTRGAGRATLLHGLARNLEKAGHTEEAIQTFRTLEKEPGVLLGSLPSDLVALYEVTALENGSLRSRDALQLYGNLVHGRWRLQKSSYMYYSNQAREWIQDVNQARDLIEEEQRK